MRYSTRWPSRWRGVLESLVIDTESDHNTRETSRRVAKMYLNEVFRGRYVPAPPVTEFPNPACLRGDHRTALRPLDHGPRQYRQGQPMALLDELVATASIVNRGS